MIDNESIITNAKNRWKCSTQSESLVCEIRSLLAEIENYRIMVIEVHKALDKLVSILRVRGGE